MGRPAFCLAVLLCCSLFAVPGSLYAAEPPHVEKFQVGLPGGKGELDAPPYRSGAWAPVYVKVKAGPDGNGRGQFAVRVEATDSENAAYHYDTPLPALVANQDYIAVAYTRPGASGEVAVRLVAADGHDVPGPAPAAPSADRQPLDPTQTLYLSVGSRLARAIAADLEPEDHKGTLPFASIDDIAYMPDRWYGYDAADVVVLSTGSEAFVKSLLDDESAPQRRRALAEWVRRGGKLIVSVGANRQLAADLLDRMPLGDADRMPLFDCRIDGSVTCPETASLAHWLAADGRARPLDNVELTRLRPGAGVTVLVSESCKDGGKMVDCPVVVESSCGLGRVWLTAFDLDEGPFAAREWAEDRKAFWNRVQSEFTPKPAAVPVNPNGLDTNEPPALLAEMQRSLEDFENVPVVSFGWVALFILIYIVIVGPLDYILLTRVFKRPELTWITFPVVVLSLSVLVYVVAYSMKGDDLRVNKIDLVEYDLSAPRQAYGTTWFTLFSPRIQNYTVGVEPSAPGWASPPPEGSTTHAVTVATLANPAQADAAGSPSLFRKPYAYAEDASGLEHVPIPVWSTRSFQASWRAAVDPDHPPVQNGTADKANPDVVRPDVNDRSKLIGTIRNNLPVPLQSVTIFYQGNYYPAPDLAPGAEFPVQALWEPKPGKEQTGQPAAGWTADAHVLAPPSPDAAGAEERSNNAQTYVPMKSRYELMKDLMFHAKATGSLMTNGGLRRFDQSWRLDEKRTAAPTARRPGLPRRDHPRGPHADPVGSGRGGVAGSRLRRRGCGSTGCPTANRSRPSCPAICAQETYVRVYIPVQPPKPDDRADEAMIETRDLTKMYGDLYALNRLTLKLERGDVYGFIGPNGAGKTTTMRILATLLNPTWGEATVCGYSIYNNAKEIRRLMGYMPDFFGVYDDMKVIEYLEFFAAAYRIKGPERRRKCDQVLELVDLGYKRDALVTSLSRGMTQRLGLARVLLHEPQVLLLDEPASGLDPRARIEMRGLLKELRSMGKTILVSSHILPELADICNKIGIIERGQLLFDGDVQTAIQQVRHARGLLRRRRPTAGTPQATRAAGGAHRRRQRRGQARRRTACA